MTLYFKKRQYNWGDSFYIYDENKERAYRVKSSVLLWKRKFEILDLDKNVLVTIRKEPKSLLKPKYYIIYRDEQRAAVTRELTLFPTYTIEGLPWQVDMQIDGEYRMLCGEQVIYTCHHEYMFGENVPVLEISDTADKLLALAMMLTINYVIKAKDAEGSTNYV